MKKLLFILLISAVIISCDDKKDYLVKIKTEYGDMTVLLYEETPLHKKNFIELAKSGRYDSTTFHRVMENFMIQGGDVAEKEGVQEKQEDRIPAEIVEGLFHVRGAIAAARQGDQGNPERKSSSTQFYIVEGNSWEMLSTDINKLYTRMSEMLRDTANSELIREYTPVYASRDQKKIMNFIVSKRAKVEETFGEDYSIEPSTGNNEAYKQAGGGYPPLDNAYTVFGRVVEGLDIISKISSVDKSINPITGELSKPNSTIFLSMEVIEMKKKDVTEKYGYEYPSE